MIESSDDNRMAALSDSKLLERAGQGDTASFETLFHRHYDRVYGLLFRVLGNRDEAEDVTQELFLKLYRKPPLGRREHNVSAWLYRTATNMAYNHIRSRQRRWRRNMVLVPDQSEPQSQPGDQLDKKEAASAVRLALTQLPQRQTQLLLLRQMGMSYKELAEVFDVAPGSVGTMLARAADAFRDIYTNERK